MASIKFSTIISTNWVRFVGATLLSFLFVATTTLHKPASANEELVTENQSSELSFSPNAPTSTLDNTEEVAAAAQIEKNLVIYQQSQAIILQEKQPQLIAQTDSSGTVGDTFGEANKLRQELLIEPIVPVGKPAATGAPGSSAGTPTAYGASWGQAFIGGGAYFPLDEGDVDGSLTVGFGLGDPIKSAGLEVAVNIISVGGQEDNFGDFGDSGTVGLKLHRYFDDGTAFAVGWSNPIKWGEANRAKETLYGVLTKSFNPVTVSVGLGSGSFASKGARQAGDNAVNLFGSVGLRLAPEASLVSSWTGSSLNLGASFAPLKRTPLVINTIFTDVTDNLDNGVGFTLSAGYSFQF